MTTRPLPETIRRMTTEALRLASALAEADEVQWKPSLTPKPREDTTERSRGGHSDPTPNIVADGRRLAVRAAVISATTDLEDSVSTLRVARENVERSLDNWNGR